MRKMSVRQMTWHHLPDLAYHNDDPDELPRDGPLLVDEEKAVECGLLTKLGKARVVRDSTLRHSESDLSETLYSLQNLVIVYLFTTFSYSFIWLLQTRIPRLGLS